MNIDKIVKLLNLTTSDSDGETLSAVRAANAILRKENKSWGDLLHAVIDHPGGGSRSSPSAFEMLDYLFACNLPCGTLLFVESLRCFFERRGHLSSKQMDILREIYHAYSRW